MKSISFFAVAAFTLSCGSAIQAAGTYPVKPIRVIVPFPAGSGTDIIARVVGQKMSEGLKQQIVVDNRAGAGAMLGMDIAAHSSPDGYNAILVTSSYTINAALIPNLSYDPFKSFTPVSMLASTPYLLIVTPTLPIKSVADLINYAKVNPTKTLFGSGGVGTASHLGGELFNTLSGLKIVHVPYRGMPQVNTDVASGQVQMAFSTLPAALPLAKSGRVRAIAVTSAKRFFAVPDLSTVAEGGVAGFELNTWQGMLVPALTPPSAIATLQRELVQSLHSSTVRDRLETEGFMIVANKPDEFAAQIKAEIAKWTRVVKVAGVKPPES